MQFAYSNTEKQPAATIMTNDLQIEHSNTTQHNPLFLYQPKISKHRKIRHRRADDRQTMKPNKCFHGRPHHRLRRCWKNHENKKCFHEKYGKKNNNNNNTFIKLKRTYLYGRVC